jgi:hypothetical protein
LGSKGSTTYQTQGYSPTSNIAASGNQALSQANIAATSPLNIPTLGTAGFNPQQSQAFGEIGNLQGAANPYINQASQYANQSTNPLANLQSYLNPYTQQVTQATQAAFNNSNQQQQSSLLGNAASQGALGGDRSAVAQAILAGQQQAQQAPVLAGIQSQGYQQSLAGAQNQAQLQAGAAYSLGSLGGEYQNLGLQGAQALYGSGAAQQGLQQTQLQNQYNQQIAQEAVPYQQAQFLAGITGGLAPAMGGTTFGNANAPGPSLWSQLAGLGTAGAAIAGGVGQAGGFGPQNQPGTLNYDASHGGVPGINTPLPNLANPTMPGQQGSAARGGRFASGGTPIGSDPFASEGLVIPNLTLNPGTGQRPMMAQPKATQDNTLKDAASIAGSVAKIAPMLAVASGGAVNPYHMGQHFEEGGTPFPAVQQLDAPTTWEQLTAIPKRPKVIFGPEGSAIRADRGHPEDWLAANQAPPDSRDFNTRWPGTSMLPPTSGLQWPSTASPTQNPGGPDVPTTSLLSLPTAQNRPDSTSNIEGGEDAVNAIPPDVAPQVAFGGYNTTGLPSGMAESQPDSTTPTPARGAPSPTMASEPDFANTPVPHTQTGNDFSRSMWAPLLQAGLGMMAGTSHFPLVNIGQGGLKGMEALNKQRDEERADMTVEQRAKQLQQQADFHRDSFNKRTAEQKVHDSLEKLKIDRDRYHNPIMSPFGDFAISLPKNPNLDKPQYYPISPTGQPGAPTSTQPGASPSATPEPPPATTSVSPPGGKVVSDDPVSMLQPGNVAASAKRDPDVGRMFFDPKSRQKGYAETQIAAKQVDKESEAASVLDTRAKSMRRNLDVISNFVKEHPNKIIEGLLSPGATGEERQAIINKYAYAAPLLGLPQLPGEVVAAINQLGKDSVLGGFRNVTAEGLSAREAQPIIKAAMGAMPSFNMPEQSSRMLISSMESAAQRQKDRQEFFSAYRKANGNLAAGWEAAFNKEHPPESYVAKAVYNVLPEERKRELPQAVNELRGARDQLMAAEKSGNAQAAEAARARFQKGKAAFDGRYGGLANYLAFGTM